MPIPLGILAVAGAGAAGGGNSFDLLETTVLSSSASSVSFSSLGSYSDYKHLQIRAAIRMDGGFTLASARIRFNGNTTNYFQHSLNGDGSSVTSTNANGGSTLTNNLPAGGAGSNIFGSTVIDILDFSSTNKNTTVRALTGVNAASSKVALTSVLFNLTNAVTSIAIDFEGLNAVAGSRFSLYGIK